MRLLAVLLCVDLSVGYNSSLFWSYYGRPSVETGGYTRHSPSAWDGGHLLSSPQLEAENEVEPQPPGLLVLGSLTKISHGPRRRREFQVYDYPGRHTGSEIEAFKNFLSKWPVKRRGGGSGERPSQVDFQQVYEKHDRKFQQSGRSEEPRRVGDCRHACSPGDGLGAPCCSESRAVFSIGPLVQPSLLENWVTGVFEFAANNPVIFTFVKSLVLAGALGVAALLWGVLGETVGVIELPRARHFDDLHDLQEEESFVLQVVGGNWLSSLEDHVRREDRRLGPHFYCCLSADRESVECLPHGRGLSSKQTFRCKSGHKYDISVNLNRLTHTSTNKL